MFRIRALSGSTFFLSPDRLDQVRAIFRQSFPEYAGYADKIESVLRQPVGQGYRASLLVAEGAVGRVDAFALVLYFEEVKSAFLDYVGTRPQSRSRGIGGALYEALREYCIRLDARALYLDVQPDVPELTPDPGKLAESRKRMRFYERYGVRVIDGTLYHKPLGDPPTTGFLLYDDLGRGTPLSRWEARRTVEMILRRRFGHMADDAYIREVVGSFRDDPVRFRPFRYQRVEKVHPEVVPQRLSQAYAMVRSPKHQLHHVRERGYFESPIRAEAIYESLGGLGLFTQLSPDRHGQRILATVHDPEFLNYLRVVCGKITGNRTVYPDAFPIHRRDKGPKHLPVQAGYYCLDADTPLSRNAYIAARDAVDTALTAADELVAGRRLVYAVCRPPGHHAGKRFFGGFCYFNNAALAAQRLARDARVVVLDLDFHHGNGTQDIFYEREDVFTVSLHGDPDHNYPYFSGFSDEVGTGKGLGSNRNYPLPSGTDEEHYLSVFEKALERVVRVRAEALVVSLGFDILKGDPTGTFVLSPRVMRVMGRRLMETGLPLLIVQEGGYSIRNIKRGCRAFFMGCAEGE